MPEARSCIFHITKIVDSSPGWCSSVDWARACEAKGRRFDSQSGHMPGLWTMLPVGDAWEATTHWCFSVSLSPSLPFSLKINFKNLKKKSVDSDSVFWFGFFFFGQCFCCFYGRVDFQRSITTCFCWHHLGYVNLKI